MATMIRLARCGGKKNPFYRMVVADRRSPRDGRFLEIVGHYDPDLGVDQAALKTERISYWLARGARPTDTARQIIRKKLSK